MITYKKHTEIAAGILKGGIEWNLKLIDTALEVNRALEHLGQIRRRNPTGKQILLVGIADIETERNARIILIHAEAHLEGNLFQSAGYVSETLTIIDCLAVDAAAIFEGSKV